MTPGNDQRIRRPARLDVANRTSTTLTTMVRVPIYIVLRTTDQKVDGREWKRQLHTRDWVEVSMVGKQCGSSTSFRTASNVTPPSLNCSPPHPATCGSPRSCSPR